MARFGRNLKSKRGSLIDLMFIGGVLLFFGIVVILGIKIATEFETSIDSNPIFNNGESRSAVENVRVKYTNTIDNTFLFLTIFLALATLVLAALVVVHPIFIPFYFIGWILVIYFCAILSNIYQSIAADVNLTAISSEVGLITAVLTALPIIVGVFGIILMIVMYKVRSYNVG